MTVQVWDGNMFVIDSGTEEMSTLDAGATRDYLLKQNNLSDIPNRNTARQNLGITVSALSPIAPKVNDLWVDLDNG